ncbi:MAG: choice-of-anchor L domain-containing protein [Flavobacteriaceae bacterium]|nr:choice-of-anchor L domain-containing protein [Flavobacteriaceae bacterium]
MEVKKYHLLILLLVVGLWGAVAQPTIVNINNPANFPPTNFTPQQLVDQVFVRGCAFTSNFTTQVWEGTGPTTKSYGAFRGFGTFPFGEGIVLTTGIAFQMGNTFVPGVIQSNDFPPNSGDADLGLITGNAANIRNATFIQFDFVPITDTISFEYLLASEEYSGGFACNFVDAFAFLIKGPGITPDPAFVGQPNEWKNIAIVPGTNDFVAPTTVRPQLTACAAVNPTFVGGWESLGNVAPGAAVVPPIVVDNNFYGRTVPLVAQSPVVPGQTYTIKLAIADWSDTAFDSGVFLKASSFTSTIDITGPNLGQFVELCIEDAPNFVMDGTVQIPGTTYQWFFNNVPIAGANGPTLTPSQSGTYRLDVTIPIAGDICTASDTAFVTIFDPAPQVVNNLLACDVIGTGVATFDLTSIIPDLFGPNQPPGDFVVTFHNTQADADNGVNPIANPTAYDNVSNPETIFVRIEANDPNLGATCFETASFTLEVSSVTAGTVTDIEVCDDDNDGVFSFDLNTKDAEAAGTMAPASVNITYHPSQADADANTNALPNPYTNTANPETVFVRVELVNDATCFDTTSFQLIVNDTPVPGAVSDFELCDMGNDGVEDFDLTQKDAEVLNGQTGITVTYHNTQADADAALNPILGLYQNTANPETIFVRLEDPATGCFDTTSFDLILHAMPIANVVPDQEVCDDPSNDGTEAFDLGALIPTVLGTQDPTAFDVTFHSSQADADTGNNALANIHNNTTNPETIFVRIENVNSTICFETTSFELRIFAQPVVVAINDQILCDDPSNDGTEAFDLDALIPALLGTQNPADFNLTFHTSQADADNNANALVSPYNNTTSPETIFVRLENVLNTTCVDTGFSFNLVVDEQPIANALPNQEICDDASNDGTEAFDLDALIPTVLGTQNPANFSVTFHTSQADADTNTNALASPYNNTASPETIFVRIENNANTDCFDTTTFELSVFAQPLVVAINDQIVCDDPSNDGTEGFD